MSSISSLEAKITPKLGNTGNYCYGCEFCGVSGGLVVGGGGLVVGGGGVCCNYLGGSTGGRFHRS